MTFVCARTGRVVETADRRRRWCCKWCRDADLAKREAVRKAKWEARVRFGARWSHEAAALRTGAGR
jgi:hypothetical protein